MGCSFFYCRKRLTISFVLSVLIRVVCRGLCLPFLLLFASALTAHAQTQAPDSSQSTPAERDRKPVQRDTAQAKAAESQGEDFLFKKHDIEKAIESFKKSVKLDPWYGHGFLMLGVAYTQAERWDQAQWAFEDAAKIEPRNAQAWLGVGSALNEKQDYAGAQKALQQCLDLQPDSAEAHYEMARALLSQQKLVEAEVQGHLAIELNNDYVSPHLLMANIYVAESNPGAALKEFRQSLQLDPDGPQSQEIKDNIATLEKAINEQPPSSHPKKP